MKEEEGKNFGICGVEVGHGRATTGTGHAKLLDFGVWSWQVRHGRATTGTGHAKLLAI